MAALAVALAALPGCSAFRVSHGASQGCTVAASSLVPPSGAWYGVTLDWPRDSVADYSRRLGTTPALVALTAAIPLTAADRDALDSAVAESEQAGTMVMLTLDPQDGLEAVTDDVAEGLGRLLDGYDRRGVPVFVRFGPEMNGSWPPWGQRPMRYVRAFRRVADAVHTLAPGSPMVWSPAYGGGYPFPGGPNETRPGTLAATILDVDGDGAVTASDDPYSPYWPGTGAVDWVGLTVRHRGPAYPGAENEVADPGEFLALLRGTYDGPDGDQRSVPDFYAAYGEQLGRPVMVTDTAAAYTPGRGGAWELAVKRSWWRQVFRAGRHDALPMLKMVTWLEEPQDGTVDWSVTRSPTTLAPFRHDLPGWLHFAADVPRCR